MEWLPTMPWNECPRSRGIDAHLPWNAQAETIARPEFETQLSAFYHRLDAALAEDVPALMDQHRGLSSPDAQQGRFQPLLEPNVAAFAKWYARQILS